MSSELDDLRKMIDQQFGQQPNPADIPLHGEGVVPGPGETVEPGAVRISVSGEARNTDAGAVVVDDAGTHIATDLGAWPDEVVGRAVRVSGIVTAETQDKGLREARWDSA